MEYFLCVIQKQSLMICEVLPDEERDKFYLNFGHTICFFQKRFVLKWIQFSDPSNCKFGGKMKTVTCSI